MIVLTSLLLFDLYVNGFGMNSCEETEPVTSARKVEKNHQWTKVENENLVESLHELYVGGQWKANTGFRAGYLKEIERMMEEKLPKCGLKGMPHIDSRIRTLKKQTMAITEMINTSSGFGWDEATKKIVCEQTVYDNWCLGHPSALGLFRRTFPHFEKLNIIYSKDRANGKAATTPAAEEEEVEAEIDDNNGIDGMDVSEAHTCGSVSMPTTKRAKKSNDQMTQSIMEVFNSINKLVDGTLSYLSEVSVALKEGNIQVPSREVAKPLHSMDILSLNERLTAAKTITSDESMSSIFLELPQNKQLEMVLNLLNY